MNTTQNPAGLTALAVMVLVWAGGLAGLDIPAEIAAAIVALTTALVSKFTPRPV